MRGTFSASRAAATTQISGLRCFAVRQMSTVVSSRSTSTTMSIALNHRRLERRFLGRIAAQRRHAKARRVSGRIGAGIDHHDLIRRVSKAEQLLDSGMAFHAIAANDSVIGQRPDESTHPVCLSIALKHQFVRGAEE